MTPSDALASLRTQMAAHGQAVLIRRYSGTGPTRTKTESEVMARLRGAGSATLVGAVVQGKFTAIVINDPLASVAAGKVALSSLLPLTTNDKLVVSGRELSIEAIDDQSRRLGGTLVGLNLQVTG